MKSTKDVITKSGLLKWLTKTVLVLGLITFSGHVSEFRLRDSEPTKTELSETRRVNSKRTANFRIVSAGLGCLPLNSIGGKKDFEFFLLHQENRIAVKFKNNIEEVPTNQQDGFLVYYYSIDSSEEFDANELKG